MAVDLAVAVDLKILGEESVILGLVVVEAVGVLGPRGHLEVHAA